MEQKRRDFRRASQNETRKKQPYIGLEPSNIYVTRRVRPVLLFSVYAMNLYIERCDLVRGADGRPSRLSNSYELRVRREMEARQSFETERSVVVPEERKKRTRKSRPRPSWKFRTPKKFSRTSSQDRKCLYDENEQPNRRGSSMARVSKFFGHRE